MVGQREVQLTPTEYDLLKLLVKQFDLGGPRRSEFREAVVEQGAVRIVREVAQHVLVEIVSFLFVPEIGEHAPRVERHPETIQRGRVHLDGF